MEVLESLFLISLDPSSDFTTYFLLLIFMVLLLSLAFHLLCYTSFFPVMYPNKLLC